VGLVVATAYGPDRAEAGHRQGGDRGLRRPNDRHVGVAAPDQLQPLGNGLRARSAGQDGALARTRGAEHDGELARGHIRDHHRDQERAHPARSPLVQDPVLALPRREAPDAAAYDDGYPFRSLADQVTNPGALGGLDPGSYAELREAVHPPGRLLVHKVGRVEIRAFSGDLRGKRRGVEERDPPDAALAVQGRIPEVLDPGPQRSNGPRAGYERVSVAVRPYFGHAAWCSCT
jgi:hypothetical protein